MPKAAPHAFHVYILTRLTEISLNPALQLAFRFGRFRGAARAISCKVSIHLPPISASSIYAVNGKRSAYTPCSAQYCSSPSAHQRRALSVAVAGLRLKHTASLQSVPAMLRFGRFRGATRAISCKVSRHLPSMMCVLGLCSQQQPLCLYSVFRAILHIAISAPTMLSQLRPLASGSSAPQACNQCPQCICHVPRRFARTCRTLKQNPHRPRLH